MAGRTHASANVRKLATVRLGLLAMSSLLALETQAANVAVVTGDFYTGNLVNQLTLAGNTVTEITTYTAGDLAAYDSVVHYGNTFTDTAALETYVSGGGVLVLTPWAGLNFGVPATIRSYADGGESSFSSPNPAVTVLNPASPLLTGVTFPAAGATNIGRILQATYVGNAGEVARWADGYGFIGLTTYGSGTAITINLQVITSDTAYTVIDQTWAAALFNNAVNFGVVLGCPVGVTADTCVIDSTTSQTTPIDAGNGTDTLELGGGTNFAFDASKIGTTYTNFETVAKTGTSTVSLTGTTGNPVDWDVQDGTLKVNGTLTGSVVVEDGATLSGNANIGGNLALNPGATLSPGNSPGTTVVGGNFIGGGTLIEEVQFNNAAAPVNGVTHDFLNIAGNVTGAPTTVNLVAFAPSGAPAATTGNGIEIVRVGGTVSPTAFQQSAPLFFGGLEYALFYLPDYSGTTDGFFLQSHLSANFLGEAAMVSAAQTFMTSCVSNEEALLDAPAGKTRAWAKGGAGNRKTGADTGLVADNDYQCGAGGIDIAATSKVRFGLSGGYGKSDSDVTAVSGVGKLKGDGGLIQAYAQLNFGNYFANLSGGYGSMDFTFDGPNTGPENATIDGGIAALQVGHIWPMTDWRLSAIGSLTYDGMDCGDTGGCLLTGTQINNARLFVKGTLRADAKLADGKLIPFLALSLSSSDTNTFANGPASLATRTNGSLFQAKGGASYEIIDGIALFADGGIADSLNKDVKGWDAAAGIKATW